MSSTCQTIHYDASHDHNIRNTKVAMARAAFCVVLCAHCCIMSRYTGQCPLQGTSLQVYLPPYLQFLPCSSLSPLPRSVAPSFLRSLHPSPLSFAPSMTTFLPHSFPSSSFPPFLHSRSHPPSHHRFLTPSRCSLHLLPLAPSLPPSLPPTLPPSLRFYILHRSVRATVPACLPASAV